MQEAENVRSTGALPKGFLEDVSPPVFSELDLYDDETAAKMKVAGENALLVRKERQIATQRRLGLAPPDATLFL